MEKLIWQQSRFHCEVSVWGPGSGWLAACCGSVCLSRPTSWASYPQAATGKISSHKTQKEWHQSHFNGTWIIGPSPLHPMAGRWAPLRYAPPGAAYVFPCDPQRCLWPDSAWRPLNKRAWPCCAMLLTGFNFVKLVTNLNSCSSREPIITPSAQRDGWSPPAGGQTRQTRLDDDILPA